MTRSGAESEQQMHYRGLRGKLDALLAEDYATPKDIMAKAAKAMSD